MAFSETLEISRWPSVQMVLHFSRWEPTLCGLSF